MAVQRSPPAKQRLWKHTRARQLARGQGVKPVVCIVSYPWLSRNLSCRQSESLLQDMVLIFEINAS